MRKALLAVLSFAILSIGLFAALVAGAQEDDSADKSAFVRFVEDKISTPDRRIGIGRIDGVLSSDVTISEITVADRDGVWLRLVRPHLVWSRLALLRGRLDIDLIEAERIEVARKPLPAETVDPAASDGFALPELPVAVRITSLSVPVVTLAPPVTGEQVTLAVKGGLTLADGSLTSDLAIDRTDATPGHLALKAGFAGDSKRLDLDLGFSEPKGGMVSKLLNLPGTPALDLTVKGAGPLADFAADLTLTTDGVERLKGRSTIAGDGDGYRFAGTLGGTFAPLVPPDYALYVDGTSTLDVEGRVAGNGAVRLDRLALGSKVLALSGSASLAADGFPESIDLTGRLSPAEGDALPLGGAGSTDRIKAGNISLAFGKDGRWQLALDVEGLETAAARADALSISGSGAAENLGDPARRRIDFDLMGASRGLVLTDPALAEAVGGELDLKAGGNWSSGAPLVFDSVTARSPTLATRFAGRLDQGVIIGRTDLDLPSLAPFGKLAGRPLTGRLKVTADGSLTPLTGAFDLALDGSAGGLSTGIAAADGLLAGETRLSGTVIRDTAGLGFRALRVANPALTLALDGRYGLKATDVTARAALADLKSMTPDATGAVTADLHVTGTGGPLTLDATVGSARIGLKGHDLAGLALGFAGALDGSALSGHLDGDASLDRVPIRLTGDLATDPDGTRRMKGLTLTAAGTRITGDLARSVAGLFNGTLAVDSPDMSVLAPLTLTDARGAARARLVLTPEGGKQTADVTLATDNLAVGDLKVGRAELKAIVRDALGQPAADGSFKASAIAAAGATVASVEGTARGAVGATDFAIRATGISAPQLSQNGIGPLGLTASGKALKDRIDLAAAELSGDAGLAARASGSIPFKGDGLSVAVTGTLPLALADRQLAVRGTRVAGTANLDLKVTGSSAKPDIAGTIRVAGASVIDPETTTRLTDIALDVSMGGGTARIETFRATVNGKGSLTASGSVGIDPAGDMPVSVDIALRQAHVTDGRIATADLGGDVTIRGSVKDGVTVGGAIDIAKAEFTIPEGMGANATLLDVRHRLPPPNVKRTLDRIAAASGGNKSGTAGGPAVKLDLAIRAPARLFVRGRGIDAELGGSLTVRGTLPAIQPVGSFNLIRGRVDVIGQRITFTSGSVTLMGDLDPYLSLTATTRSDQITVTATVEGQVSDPTIVLSSVPELPQDEVLARFLFKRSINDLSAVQIAQLASAVAQLAGGGRDNGILDRLRASVGLDDLDVTTDKEGNAAVTAGRYISERVYLGVTAGSGGQTGVSVNLDITDDLKAKAQATQAESKVGVYYEHEY